MTLISTWMTPVLSLAMMLPVAFPQTATVPDAALAEAAATSLLSAFTGCNVAKMKEHFADQVQFVGDPQFLGENRGPQVLRDLTRDQLMAAYTKMFSGMSCEQWTLLVKQSKATLTRATRDGTHVEDTTGILPPAFVKSGDYVYELRFPGTGLDDVILFILRPVGGQWKVTAHWADY
jgi:hypothetical protein